MEATRLPRDVRAILDTPYKDESRRVHASFIRPLGEGAREIRPEDTSIGGGRDA